MLRRLVGAEIDFVLIGGVAVGAHGVIRGTQDIDICPSPDPQNLERLAALLGELGAQQFGVESSDFAADEMPYDPTRAGDLAGGGNFRLETPFGLLDLMQWIPGIDADQAYSELAADAVPARAFGIEVPVSSLEKLRLMKRAAGRPQDLQDLEDLAAAHPEKPE